MNILNDVTLTLFSGDIVALIGDNGCGKTTFLELIAGFFKVQSGVITYYESDKKSLPKLSGFFDVVNGRFCPQSVRRFCPIIAGFNAGTYKVPACVL